MSSRDEPKKVSFFQLQGLKGGETFKIDQINWLERLQAFGERDLPERSIDGLLFDPYTEAGTPLVGVHKPLNTAFMTQLPDGAESRRVEDLMNDEEKRGRAFAHSTAVRFMSSGNAFALALGGRSSPHAGSIEKLANVLAPLTPYDRSMKWKVVPLTVKGEMEKFEKADGVTAFETKFRTMPDLLDLEPRGRGVASFGDAFAKAIQGEVEIKMTIRVLKDASAKETPRRMRKALADERDRLAREKNPLRAKIVTEAGREEWIDLVSHQLADSIDLSDGVLGERRVFSALLDELDAVGTELEDRVKELTSGQG